MLVGLERVELELEVPEVPERDGLVCRAGGQDELGVGVEAQAVDLGGVRVHTPRTATFWLSGRCL